MWPLETLKIMNLKNYQKIPIDILTKEASVLDNTHSYKVLTEPFKYKNKIYYYLAPNNNKGIAFISSMLDNLNQATYVTEIDSYIL